MADTLTATVLIFRHTPLDPRLVLLTNSLAPDSSLPQSCDASFVTGGRDEGPSLAAERL